MPDNRITELLEQWEKAKDAEQDAKEWRLNVEQEIVLRLAKPETFKGTVKLGDFVVTYGESVKVDSEALQEVARRDYIHHSDINRLFRWKAELNAKAWKGEPDEELKRRLSFVIETKPSKPSFSRK